MITEELRNKIEQIKLRFTEIGEQLEHGINSGNAIVATQKTLLAMIENAENNVKQSLAEFVEATKSTMAKTEADLEKAKLRLKSAEETEEFLTYANEETLVSIYHLLVVAGLEQPVKKVYEDEPEEPKEKDEELNEKDEKHYTFSSTEDLGE